MTDLLIAVLGAISIALFLYAVWPDNWR